MPHRYTIQELKTLSDYELLEWVVRDRMQTTTNSYAPLYQRLSELSNKLYAKKELTK